MLGNLYALFVSLLHGISQLHSAKAYMHPKNEGQKCICQVCELIFFAYMLFCLYLSVAYSSIQPQHMK